MNVPCNCCCVLIHIIRYVRVSVCVASDGDAQEFLSSFIKKVRDQLFSRYCFVSFRSSYTYGKKWNKPGYVPCSHAYILVWISKRNARKKLEKERKISKMATSVHKGKRERENNSGRAWYIVCSLEYTYHCFRYGFFLHVPLLLLVPCACLDKKAHKARSYTICELWLCAWHNMCIICSESHKNVNL